MSSNENDVKDAPSKSGEQEQQNLVSRVASLPLVSAAYDMVSTTYTSIKETHPVIRSICDVAETGVRTITSATASGAQPVLDQQEPQELLVSTASDSACESLDQLEEKLPVLQQPGDQVASDAKELVSTLTGAKDAVCSTDTGVKDAVTSMVGVAIGAVQETMEVTKSADTSSMSTVLGSSMGQMIMSGVDLLPETSELLVDHYLPMTDEELAKLAVSLEGSEEAPTEQQSYYVCLGSLSSALRQRAYQHALGKMRQARQRTLEALSQLQQTIDLMEHAKQAVDQKAHDGQEKLQQMWLEWHKGQPGVGEDSGSPQPEEMVSQALATSQNLILQVQATCHSLLPNIQGLPAALQEKVQQAYENMGELQISFSNVQSCQELSEGILTQTREKVTKAQESLDELLEYVVQNTPLTWIVGPFAPAGDSTEKAEVLAEAEKVEPEVVEAV
ncbi:perilipin-3-like isoform X1 [Mauremys reevesii]|uniref:perilipin-3-like isoform X1 n=1 Tax=Mauremys reevesii TaxID=260615 RepID=UPI0019400E05|nr:perilipin-3-like isoform X1 [Mauremys reevesii]